MTKIPDSVIVGYRAWGEPSVLGEIRGHGLTDEIIGTVVEIRGVTFTVNVSYVPSMPGRKSLVPILEPRETVPSSFWAPGEKVDREPTQQRELPF